ncbi:hypothetical protein DWY16_10590 [Heyndrickxia coagulans]|nr:hypothetical protein DWY16_10590 [Heyndrickxia coagulans]
MPGQKRTADKSSAVFSYLYKKHCLLLSPECSPFYSKSLLEEGYGRRYTSMKYFPQNEILFCLQIYFLNNCILLNNFFFVR